MRSALPAINSNEPLYQALEKMSKAGLR
ncbi:hypothetical protein, partial [Halalkalibacter lacteus]